MGYKDMRQIGVVQVKDFPVGTPVFPVEEIRSIKVDFPSFLEHGDKEYLVTTKFGVDLATGTIPRAEYSTHDGSVVWMDIYGNITNG